jgi:peptidoglycan hydrolase-like protein with peptidoglycan-binding domain
MWKVGLVSVLAAGLVLSALGRAEAQCGYTSETMCKDHETDEGCWWQPPCEPWTAATKRPGFILELQKQLKVQPNGKIGPETEAAIRKFQEERKLKVKEPGKLDFETYKALRLDKTK